MSGNQINVEYFFRLLYDLIYGQHASLNYAAFEAWFAHLWLWIIAIGYLLSIIALIVIIYVTMRLFELRKREKEHYGTVILAPDAESGGHPRWKHIQALAQGTSPSEWREAIIEADILLAELLTDEGYEGNTVSEKLNSAEQARFVKLEDAWEGHKVRNQIAHQGSAFQLDQNLTQRTLSHYEAVFRALNAI